MSANTTIVATSSGRVCAGRITNVIRTGVSTAARSILLLLVLHAADSAASTGSIVIPSPIPVVFNDPHEDISVKVWGGKVVIQRGYSEGEWHPNLDWTPLTLLFNYDGSVQFITRSRTTYSTIAPGVYQDPNSNILRKTATGYRWSNRANDWIEYNPAGEIKAYGNRNGTIATFKYSGTAGATTSTGVPLSEGNITGVLDHFGTQILWLEYIARPAAAGKYDLVSVRDNANRTVTYQWTPTTNGITLAVKDVNNNTWNYVLSGIYPGSISGNFGPVPAGVNATTGLNITDPEGHTTSRTWYYNGGLASMTYPDGSQDYNLSDYDAATQTFYRREVKAGGKITETWSGLKQDRNRGEYGRIDVNGVTVSKQSVDTANRITTTTDARSLNTAVTRDQWNNVTKIVYPDSGVVSIQYDSTYSNITQYIDENGAITKNSYDAKGNLLKTIVAVGLPEQRTTEFNYNADSQLTSMTRKGDANTADAVTLYDDYDDSGNAHTVTDAEGGITRFTWDVMGNILTRTDPRGKLWKNTYDNAGRLLTVTDPLNHTTTIAYDKAGLPVTLTDAANNNSTLGFDPAGRLLSVTDPYGAKTSYTYDAAGKPVTITNAEKHTQKQDYDLDGRLIKQTDGNNNVTQFVYGNATSGLNGLLSSIIYPTLNQDLRYDQRNRITHSTDTAAGSAIALDGHASQTTQNQYDAKGNLTVVTDPANRSTVTKYNANGEVTQTTDPANGTTSYGYDARGNLITVKDAKGNTHRFEYDKLDRMVKEIRPLGQTIVYAYDPNGNLIQVTDPKGQIKQYVYDDANRRTHENHYLNAAALTAKNATKSISYSYNDLDGLTGYDDGATTATYTYDAKQLRQTGESVNFGSFSLATSTTWNALGQKNSITYPDGASYTYTYDTNDQLSTVNFPTGFGSITFNSYLWTVPSQITLPGGTVRTMDYDGLLRVKDFSVKDPGQSQVMGYQYSYETTGDIATKANGTDTVNYSYDTLDHLIGATYTNSTQTNEAYTYDQVANRLTDHRTSAEWTYNENNQLKTADSITYTYDDNGNTINQTDSANPANTRNYVYDTDNRLIEVRSAGNTLIAAYSYDPFGRRLSKDTGSSKTYYFYNADGLIAEADATGQVTRSYGYAPGSTFTTNPLWLKTGAAYYTYQNDHLGTPMKLLNQSGVTVWSATYDTFGNATVDPASIVTNNLRFPGQYYDAETNLHYNWMRYYDPRIGRYISSDPISLKGGINIYIYAYGNSLRYVDPYGLFGMADMPMIPQGVVNFSAGFGDSISFGLTDYVRDWMGTNGAVNKCSAAYRNGEYADMAFELGTLGLSAGLKGLAKNASRSQVRNATRPFMDAFRETGDYVGGFVHHENPLFGHPGGASSMFPTGGLPAWLNSGSWNLKWFADRASHNAAHRSMREMEAGWDAFVNPGTTSLRAGRDIAQACECQN